MRYLVGLGVALVVLTGCASGSDEPAPTLGTTAAPEPSGDGTLVIGHLATPATAAASAAGVELALADITRSASPPADVVTAIHLGGNDLTSVPDSLAALTERSADALVTNVPLAEVGTPPTVTVLLTPSGRGATAEFTGRVLASDPVLTDADTEGAAEAYDGTVIVALGALAAGDDAGPSIRAALTRVLEGPIDCTSYGECAVAIGQDKPVRYVGQSGAWILGENGVVQPQE